MWCNSCTEIPARQQSIPMLFIFRKLENCEMWDCEMSCCTSKSSVQINTPLTHQTKCSKYVYKTGINMCIKHSFYTC